MTTLSLKIIHRSWQIWDFKPWSLEVFSGTVHWFCSKTSFHPLLWTSSGLKGSWKLSAYIRFGSLRSVKSVKTNGNGSLRSAKSVKPNGN